MTISLNALENAQGELQASSAHSQKTLAQSMNWLANSHPRLAKEINQNLQNRFYKEVKDKGRTVNLETGGTRLYEPDALKQTNSEIKEFFAQSKRYINTPSLKALKPVAHSKSHLHNDAFHREIYSTILRDKHSYGDHKEHANNERSLLVVFGLGLGYHIAPLIKRLRPCNVCIIETRKESIYFSASTHNFANWHKKCAERNGSLYFIVANDIDLLEATFNNFLQTKMHFFCDSFFVYEHSASSVTIKLLYPRLLSIIKNAEINRGFFEDQIRMLHNSIRNLSLSVRTPFIKLNLGLRPKRSALIIANGPSLDDSLPYLSKLCVGRTVFSCGSALFTLLKNGIVPDFQCEIENIFPKVNHINKSQEAGYDLSKITLLTAITVQCDIVSVFNKRIFISRALTPLNYILAIKSIGNISPTVSNTAFVCANAIGFTEQYFLGTDMGYKQGRKHHAKDAVHFLDKEREKAEEKTQSESNLVFRGNFGGQARTQIILYSSKQVLEYEAESYTLHKLYNCSDGVKLKGFSPLLPTLIKHLTEEECKKLHSQKTVEELCPNVSLADNILLSRIEKAQAEQRHCADTILKIFAPIAKVDSVCDLQSIHNKLKELFVHCEEIPTLAKNDGNDTHNFLLNFYVGTIFIFIKQIYNYYISVSHAQWCRIRSRISAMLQSRIKLMQLDLQQALALEQRNLEVLAKKEAGKSSLPIQ